MKSRVIGSLNSSNNTKIFFATSCKTGATILYSYFSTKFSTSPCLVKWIFMLQSLSVFFFFFLSIVILYIVSSSSTRSTPTADGRKGPER